MLLVLVLLALLSRLYTTNSLAGEPTSDEYFFAIYARDLFRAWGQVGSATVQTLSEEGRVLATEVAALSFLVPWDQVTLGRSVQALFNALAVPMTFVLARQIGLARGAGVAAALLLLAAPEFQEFAWRFWSDSQATFLGMVYLAALVRLAARYSPVAGLVAVLAWLLLFVTKESAAATLAPFLPLAVLALARGRVRRWRARLLLAAFAAVGLVALVAFVLVYGERTAGRGLLGRLTLPAWRVLSNLPSTLREASQQFGPVAALFGPFELSVALVWAWTLGAVWLTFQAARSIPGWRTHPGLTLGWAIATACWLPTALIPFSQVRALGLPDPWLALAAAGLAAGTAVVATHGPPDGRRPWGLALLGAVVLAFLAQRIALRLTPDLPVAFTYRSFMPITPLLAILAGAGVWGAAGAVRLLVPGRNGSGRGAAAVLAALVLVGVWSPLVRQRLTSQSMLGRPADRGADPATPQGLRVEAMVEAERWLTLNLQPTDRIATSIPRHLAWYADLGSAGLEAIDNLGARASMQEERRGLVMERMGPNGVDYVTEFNVDWTQPDSESARQWQLTYEWLATRPNVEIAYLQRDPTGKPVFYVARNHGYAVPDRTTPST